MKLVRLLRYLGVVGVLIGSIHSNAQNESILWFPEKANFPILQHDLLEENFYTGVFFLNAKNIAYEGLYIPVNIGIRKPFLQLAIQNIKIQIALGAASYSQFEIIRYDQNTLRGGLLNNDYKASGLVAISKNNHKLRCQLFHISSHLGDDYMLRNSYFELNDKTVNYEQFDITYLLCKRSIDMYGGLGYVVTPNAYRERLMMQLGLQGNYLFHKNFEFSYGFDSKFYAEYNYTPNLHFCLGINVLEQGKCQLNFSIDGYTGHIPYSTLKMGGVNWLGISTKVYI